MRRATCHNIAEVSRPRLSHYPPVCARSSIALGHQLLARTNLRQHFELHRVTELFRRVKGTVSLTPLLYPEGSSRGGFEDRIPRVERTLHPSGLTPTHRILHAGRIRSPGRLTHVFCQVFLSTWYLYDVASLHMIRPGLNTRTTLSWAPTTDLWPDVETLSVLNIC